MRTLNPETLPSSGHTREAHPRQATRDRPLRICFLIDELAVAGTETQLLALIRHLDRRRFQSYLVLLRGESATSQALEPDCCPVLRLGVRSLTSLSTLAKSARLLRFLRSEQIDVLQVYFPDSSYLGIPAAWLAGVRHRLRTRNNIGHWMTPVHRFLGRTLNCLTTGTVANCQAARAALLAAERPRPESVVVLENGVDLERFLSLPPPEPWTATGAIRVGAVANLRPVKGLDVLVRAFLCLAERFPQLTLHLGGEGEQRSQLEKVVCDARRSDRVEFVGRVTDVPGFLARLDVAVLPSRAEGMSNALLEYMAAARPIVATAVGATPELIEDGEHGLLVPPDNDGALADALDWLLTHPDRARQVAGRARLRAQDRYSRAAMVRRFEVFYETLEA
jgi:glycosyltransferase involved in cell wall biosynthesis